MKNIFLQAVKPYLPRSIYERKDKMGFPTPLAAWITGAARQFVNDVFSTQKALQRELIDNRKVLSSLDSETRYGRKIWGLLSLELWQQEFHDREAEFKAMLKEV
jgi:asparagine synthase (glutamine-hydrolysing)